MPRGLVRSSELSAFWVPRFGLGSLNVHRPEETRRVKHDTCGVSLEILICERRPAPYEAVAALLSAVSLLFRSSRALLSIFL